MKRIFLLSAMIAGMLLSQTGAYAQKQCGIVAHRGFWNCEEAGYAKNSIAALRCAQEQGFWGSEFDVNMTADSVLIVFHDSKIKGKRIEKYPFEEAIKKYVGKLKSSNDIKRVMKSFALTIFIAPKSAVNNKA